jgi:hypothetical protein
MVTFTFRLEQKGAQWFVIQNDSGQRREATYEEVEMWKIINGITE